MIKPLTLGNRTFSNNLIQGPLAGVSCAPFRALTWAYSKPAFSCTEMISCKTLLHQSEFSARRFIKKDPNEGPVCFQLSSNNPQELGEATKRVTDYGADLIDLNCGCPKKKIRSRGAGSSLLSDPSKIYQLITSMKQNTHVPVSIKIRIEADFNKDIVKAVSDAGADFVIVHGRHWAEGYDIGCNYDGIQFFVENLKIPVIGNGDIACVDSLQKMFKTGCAGVMIGRAGVGQPWLIQKLIKELNSENFSAPSQAEISNIFIEHVKGLATLLGSESFAIIQARKFAKYYARGLETRADFCAAVNVCDDLQTLTAISAQYLV